MTTWLTEDPDLPSEDEIRSARRRASWTAVVLAVLLVAVVVVPLALRAAPPSMAVAFLPLVAIAIDGFVHRPTRARALRRREVLAAGSRARRRRLRLAVLAGRTDRLDESGRRICRDWSRVAAGRLRVRLPGALLYVGLWAGLTATLIVSPAPWWLGGLAALGTLATVLDVVGSLLLLRSTRRFLDEATPRTEGSRPSSP